jgi:antitoxin component of MazEF toxin-antitoxin module
VTKITGLRANQWGLPSQLYGYRHKAIIRSNSAQTNITEEITTVEALPGNALKGAKDEHKTDVDNLQLDVDNLQLDVDNLNLKVEDLKLQLKSARVIAVEATHARDSTATLLATANERLRDNSLEEVTAKAAPGGTGTAYSPTGVEGGAGGSAIGTTTPMALFPPPQSPSRSRLRKLLNEGLPSLFPFIEPMHVITYPLVPVYKQASGSSIRCSY